MNGFDMEACLDLQNLLRPQVITGNGTGADQPVTTDMHGGRARAIVFVGSLSAGTTFTATIEHADDAPGGPWAPVPGGAFAPITAGNTGASLGIPTRSLKKYVRLSYTAAGGVPNLVATAFLGGFRKRIN